MNHSEAAEVLYVCLHALKATAATLLAATGAPAEVIAEHLSRPQLERTFAVIVGRKR